MRYRGIPFSGIYFSKWHENNTNGDPISHPMVMNKKRKSQSYQDITSPKSARVMAGLMISLTLLGSFFAGLFPIRSSNDPWWHLKTGEYLWHYFLENGFAFPPFDVFAYTGEETPWINHEWLGDLIFYWAYALGGIQGAVILKSLIIALTFALFIHYMYRNGVSWKISCVGAIIALLASQVHLYLRPFIFTYLFVVIFLHLILCLQSGEHTKKAFFAAVFGEVIWINLHGGGLLGIILFGFWWVSELTTCLLNWFKETPTAPSFKRLQFSTLALLLIILASLANPAGYHIHLLPSKVTSDLFLVSNIGELSQPPLQHLRLFEFIILGLLCLPMMRAGSLSVFDGLSIVFFAHQALNHVRHVPLFALIAVPPLMCALAEERRALLPPREDHHTYKGFWGKLYKRLVWGLKHHLDLLLIFLLIAYVFGWGHGNTTKIWKRNWNDLSQFVQDGYFKKGYPEKACNFIEFYKIPGPMFNHDNFAGFLIWRFSPEKQKVWTDTRYDLWGSQYMKEELGVLRVMEIPLGFSGENHDWMSFDQYRDWRNQFNNDVYKITTREEVDALVKSDPFTFAPGRVSADFTAWYESGKPYWQYVLDKYNANYIITYGVEPISRYLKNNYKGWILLYEGPPDEWYSIHIRNTAENSQWITKLGLNHKEQYPE
jgi:hypothetical protein